MILTSSISYGQIGIEDELRSYILGDFETGEILEEYNIDEVVEIASISKLMTYLVVMDEVSKGRISLDDRISIDEDVASIRGSSLRLEVGEVFTVKELLDASIVVSANDGTYALAKYIAGSEALFARMMNEKAIEIGLKNARFYNSTGLPVAGRDVQNIMTTKEIFQLSKYIMEEYPEIIESSNKPAIEVISRNYFQKNTNPLLLKLREVDGLKTGFTNKAGYCYVSTFNILGEKNMSEDFRLISIVMGTRGVKERDELGRRLVEYGIENYSKKIFFDKEKAIESLEFPKGNILEIEAFPREDFSKLVKNKDEIKIKTEINEGLRLPIEKGKKIGKATVEREGDLIFQTDIILKENVKRANYFVLLGRYIYDLYIRIIENL